MSAERDALEVALEEAEERTRRLWRLSFDVAISPQEWDEVKEAEQAALAALAAFDAQQARTQGEG